MEESGEYIAVGIGDELSNKIAVPATLDEMAGRGLPRNLIELIPQGETAASTPRLSISRLMPSHSRRASSSG